ncbi:MAG TPA: hypothetical protein VGD36_18035, partial [Xanthobacteraceae bacterium]
RDPQREPHNHRDRTSNHAAILEKPVSAPYAGEALGGKSGGGAAKTTPAWQGDARPFDRDPHHIR